MEQPSAETLATFLYERLGWQVTRETPADLPGAVNHVVKKALPTDASLPDTTEAGAKRLLSGS